MYKKTTFLLFFVLAFLLSGARFWGGHNYVFAASSGEAPAYVTATLKVHFIPLSEVFDVLNQMKSASGRVIINEETKTLILVDTSDQVKAMEAVLKAMDVQMATKTITLKYVPSQEALLEVEKLLTPQLGAVFVDVDKNQLTVTDSIQTVEKISQFIEELDIRRRKMVLQVKLVQIALDDQNLSGVDWQGSLEKYQRIRLKGSYDFLDGDDEDRMLSVGSLSPSDFPMLLEALDTVGLVREYPLTDIDVHSQEQILLSLKVEDASLVLMPEAISAITSYTPSKSELLFAFKPQLTRDHEVKTSFVCNPSSVILQTRFSMVTAIGDMIVVGGIIAEEKAIQVKKIPLVGDIPLLGIPFRYRDNTVKREEFVLFITPQLASMSSTQTSSSLNDVEEEME